MKLVTRGVAMSKGSRNVPLYVSMFHLCQSVGSTTARPTEGAVCSVTRGSNPGRGNRFLCFQNQLNVFWATRHINSVVMPGLHPQSPCQFVLTFFSPTNHAVLLLPQSSDCSRYPTRPIPAPPPLGLHLHTDLRTHDFEHCPDL